MDDICEIHWHMVYIISAKSKSWISWFMNGNWGLWLRIGRLLNRNELLREIPIFEKSAKKTMGAKSDEARGKQHSVWLTQLQPQLRRQEWTISVNGLHYLRQIEELDQLVHEWKLVSSAQDWETAQ
ncbi:hypothetical protein ScPMuIL_018789 [Solemya velum]